MNKINTFGLDLIYLGGTEFTAHIIAVNHEMCSGVFVYSTLNDTRQAVQNLHESLDKYAPLKFDSHFDFSDFAPGILEIYTRDSKGLFSKVSNHQIYKR